MIKNHFLVVIRYFLKNKRHSIVSVLGLAVGMAGALLIYEYVSFGKSFDNFHVNHQHIFRLTSKDHETTDHRALLVAAILAGTLIVKTSQAASVKPVDALKGK